MKRQVTGALAAGLSLALLTAPLAMAQDDHHGDQRATAGHVAPPAHAAPAHEAPAHAAPAHGPMTAHQEAPAGRAATQNHSVAPQRGGFARPATPAGHNWHQGSRYTGGRNVVDYNRYHLRRPPGGYEWVRDGNQFVLIAISTGIIATVLAANGY